MANPTMANSALAPRLLSGAVLGLAAAMALANGLFLAPLGWLGGLSVPVVGAPWNEVHALLVSGFFVATGAAAALFLALAAMARVLDLRLSTPLTLLAAGFLLPTSCAPLSLVLVVFVVGPRLFSPTVSLKADDADADAPDPFEGPAPADPFG